MANIRKMQILGQQDTRLRILAILTDKQELKYSFPKEISSAEKIMVINHIEALPNFVEWAEPSRIYIDKINNDYTKDKLGDFLSDE